MTVFEGVAGQAEILEGTPLGIGTGEKRPSGKDDGVFVVIPDMKRRLGRIFKTRIAKRLHTEVVLAANLARVVAEQIDIVTVVRFIGGTGYYHQRRNLFAGLHGKK